MKGICQRAMTLTALAVGAICSGIAQTGAPTPSQSNVTAHVDPPAPSTSAATVNTPPVTAKSEIQPEVAAELLALKTRIEQLEKEVSLARAAQPDSIDAATLDAAKKELTAGMMLRRRPR